MINVSHSPWHEFLLRTLTLHWLTALVVVLLVAVLVASARRLNATTRHNIWLLTLASFVVMPLLVFAPRPTLELRPFAASQTSVEQLQSDYAPFDASEPGSIRKAESVGSENDSEPVFSQAPVQTSDAAADLISLSSVIKGVFVFWLIGALFLLRRLWNEYRAARALELQSDSVTPYFERRFDQLCERLGIDERPLIRFHAGINAPMTVGLIRVWVAIPMTWRESIDDSVFDQTLTHELGHIARKDPLIHTVQRLLSVLFWMYPAVWYVSRQLEIERESACDDWVLTHDGKSNSYANNLLDVAESLYLQPQVLAVGCMRSHSQLSRRIQNLLNKSSDHKVHSSWKLLALTSVGLMATLSVSAVVWPDARQLAPPTAAEMPVAPGPVTAPAAITGPVPGPALAEPSSSPRVPPVADAPAEPRLAIASAASPSQAADAVPVAKPAPAPRPQSTRNAQKRVTVIEDDHGKLTIEHYRNGKSRVIVEPEITRKDPLLYAAWTGDVAGLKERITQHGDDINQVFARSKSPRTALEAAILTGNEDMVKTLIELGVDLSPDSSADEHQDSQSPLTIAAMAGRHKVAKILLANDAGTDKKTLATAVQNRDSQMIDILLSRSDCDCMNPGEVLPIAIRNQDLKSVEVLLKHDADVSEGVLLMTVQGNNTKLLKKLLKQFDGVIDSSALTVAIQNRNAVAVDLLMKAGAEPGDGALTLAVQQRDAELVRKLVNAADSIEEGALVMAVQQGDTKSVDYLIKAGAPVKDGALVIAVQQGDSGMVKQLLRNNPDLEGASLIIAIQRQEVDMVKMLLDAGADVDDTALMFAAQVGNAQIIRLIERFSGKSVNSVEVSSAAIIEQLAAYQADGLNDGTARKADTRVSPPGGRQPAKMVANNTSAAIGFKIAQWPVRAKRISLAFGETAKAGDRDGKRHKGLDFPVRQGTPVHAVEAGHVVEADYSEAYGYYVVLDHGNGYKTRYGNNQVNVVDQGDFVDARQKIAEVGDSSRSSTGPHLHFEVQHQGERIDPESLFAPVK